MRKQLLLVSLMLVFNGIEAKDSFLHIPYSPKTPAVETGRRSATTKQQCLNGKWDFLPIRNDKEFPGTLEFFRKTISNNVVPPQNGKWEKILVPSMWAYYWGMAFLDDKGEDYASKWGGSVNRAWYRRRFLVPEEWDNSKRVKLKFDGAAGFTKVFLNGHEIGSHYGSLFAFEFDITDKVNHEGQNELCVYSVKRFRARRGEFSVELPDGRQNQYGIYRNVWLKSEAGVIPENTQIITSVRKKTIHVSFDITNQSDRKKVVEVFLDIVEPGGKLVKGMGSKRLIIEKGESIKQDFKKSWTNPKLWDVGQPNMYFTRIRLMDNKKLICEKQQRFGFREFWMDGPFFYLNGKKFTFRGDWIHTFWSGCPAKMYPDYMKLVIKQMQLLNFQGPRFSATDSPDWLLDLLDEAGFPIIATGITPNYYGDPYPAQMGSIVEQTKQWIRRDRNHPSILLWSTMNEATAHSKFHPRYKWQKQLVEAIAEEDPTRPQYNDGHASTTGPVEFFTTGNLAGELAISCGHYGNIYACTHDYIGFLNAPKYWPRKRPFIDGEEGVFGILSLYYPALAVRTAGIKGLFFDIEERRALSGRWLKLLCYSWRAWEIPGLMGFDSNRASWENPFPVIRKDYNRQYHQTAYLEYENINSPGPKGQLAIGHGRDDEVRANPWTKDYPEMKATSYAKYVKAAYTPIFASIARNRESNYYSGALVSKKIDLVNDSRNDAKAFSLTWNLYDDAKKVDEKSLLVNIPQGKVTQKELTFTMPQVSAYKELKLNVMLSSENGEQLSSETLMLNIYPNVDFSFLKSRKIMMLDPLGDTSSALAAIGFPVPPFDLSKLSTQVIDLLLIGREAFAQMNSHQKNAVERYIKSGGNVFFFRQKTKRKVSACLVDKSAPNHPVFKGLKPGIISNWNIKPDSEILKFPLNWPTSGRFNMLALIGAEGAGRHELAIIENYIGKGRLIACNLELTDSIPAEPEAMILLSNILNEYSVPSNKIFKKSVYINSPEGGILSQEPFSVDAEIFSSAFHNMDLVDVNTVILGDLEKLDNSSLDIIKEKLESFRGNILVLPQKNYRFINSLLGAENGVKANKLETYRGGRQNAKGIIGFYNKGKEPLSQGLESFFQRCQTAYKGLPLTIATCLFEKPHGWTSLLMPYNRIPGKSRGEFGAVPIEDQLLINKTINGKNVVLSCLELPNANPAINRIYLSLLSNLQVGMEDSIAKDTFLLCNKNKKDWMVRCGGLIYNLEAAAQLNSVHCAPTDGLKLGRMKDGGISLIRTGFFGLAAPVWRFIPGMRKHPGDVGIPQISGLKKDGKIVVSRKGVMKDPKTQVKMEYESEISFDKNGKMRMSYKFKVIGGKGKYKTALSEMRLNKDWNWTGKQVAVTDQAGKEILFKWPSKDERCHKRITKPKRIVLEPINGITWTIEVGASLSYLTLKHGYHKGFSLVFQSEKWGQNLELKKGDAFTFDICLYPEIQKGVKEDSIFNSIKLQSVLPMSNFEHGSEKTKTYFFVNIVKKCNAAFNGSKWSEKKSSVFKMPDLKGGDYWLNGTPYHIINADTDEREGGDPGQAMSMIIMKGEYRPEFPETVTNIQVGEKAMKLYFLQSAVYMHSTSNKWDKKAKLDMWKYRINYEDGSSATVPVIHHVNIKDWYNQKGNLPGAKIAYVERKNSKYFGVWTQEWTNPNPGKVISSIDIESSGRGIPVILAISGEKQQTP